MKLDSSVGWMIFIAVYMLSTWLFCGVYNAKIQRSLV